MTWIEEGNPSSPLWLIGEAPGYYEEQRRRPFVGPSGDLLNNCLSQAGLSRHTTFLTNICHLRPPVYTDRNGKRVENDIDQWFASLRSAKAQAIPELNGRHPTAPITEGLQRLRTLIEDCHPRLLVLLGNTPLWAVAAQQGITKWRGSIIDCVASLHNGSTIRCIPAFHPADCLPARSPHHRPLLVHDLERAKRELERPSPPPHWQHLVEPKPADVRDWFDQAGAGTPLTCDIETRCGAIACIGFARSTTEAICLPLSVVPTSARPTSSYWSLEDEIELLHILKHELTSRSITFHNGIFDCQYIARQWGFAPRYADDTMIMQHTAFPGLIGGKIDPVTGRTDKRGSSISLSFISSLYCTHYSYWKDDGRLFDPVASLQDGENNEAQLWRYNCEDCCRTFECGLALRAILDRANLLDQYRFEMDCLPVTFRMMYRGLRIDIAETRRQRASVITQMHAARDWLDTATGTDFNPESSPQMRALFYDDLALPLRLDKHTRQPSLKDHDLHRIADQYPLLAPLITQIQDYRTLDTVKDDLTASRLSPDRRLRTALNPAYVETFRYSSNETAFGEGGNLQNLPRSPED